MKKTAVAAFAASAFALFGIALSFAVPASENEAQSANPLPKVPSLVEHTTAGGSSSSAYESRKPGTDAGAPGASAIALADALPLPNPAVMTTGPDGDQVVTPASGDPEFLAFAAGKYSPPAGETIDPELGSAFAELGTDGRTTQEIYAFVMLKKRLTASRLEELQSLGVRTLGQFPWASLRVAIKPEAIPAVAAHEAVRWVGVPRTWQKIHPRLVADMEKGSPTGTFKVIVSVHESDLCDASTSIAGPLPNEGGPETPKAAGNADAVTSTWRSNGWMQHRLEQTGLTVREYLPEHPAFRVTVTPAQLEQLVQLDFVLFAEAEVTTVANHDESTPMINTDETRNQFNGEASHQSIAGIVDSGVDVAHTALNHIYWVSWNESGMPGGGTTDICEHGSHVTGTILGEPSSPNQSYRGNAPGLGTWQGGRFRIVKWLGDTGNCSASAVDLATVISHFRNSYTDGSNVSSAPPQVVNNSWGASPGATDWIGSEYNARVIDDEVYNQNQVYVFAAGNDGAAGAGTIGLPAVAKNALTVGSVMDFENSSTEPPGTVTPSSSLGPCGDGRWKPNVAAPGRWIRSVDANSGTGFDDKSGTSMATPHVTGLVAQLVDHHSFLRHAPARVISLLESSAITKNDQALSTPFDSHLDTYGCGRVDAYKSNWTTSNWGWLNWGFDAIGLSSYNGDFTVGAGATRLVVCMTYLEPSAAAGAGKALVNDWDLYIDQAPIDTANNNTGEWVAQQSTNDNNEIRILNSPQSGAWRWKAYPTNAGFFSTVHMSVTVFVIYGDTTPTGSFTTSADDIYVQPNESVNVTAGVTPSSYVASAVFLATSATSTPAYTGATTTLKDGFATDLLSNQHSGRSVLLGDIVHGVNRSATWTVDWASEGVKPFSVALESDNFSLGTNTVNITVDGTDPSLVTGLGSSNHTANVWSTNPNITYTWSAATDNLSGVDGYGIFTSSGAPSTPADVKDINAVTSFAEVLSPSASGYYFNIKTVDRCGNWTNTSANAGPYLIDNVAPGGPTGLSSSTHVINVWSTSGSVTMNWTGATDAHSGIAGYDSLWDHATNSIPGGALDLAAGAVMSTTALTSSPNAYYFHIRAKDVAGNWGTTQHSGPYLIDSNVPLGPTNLTSSTHVVNVWSTVTSVTMNWTAGSDAASGLAGYDSVWDHVGNTIPNGALDLGAGAVTSTTPLTSSASGWFFHIRGRDVAGNWGSVSHFGPVLIDNGAPTGPTNVHSTSHTANVWSQVTLVAMVWTASTDAASGIAGYDSSFDHAPAGVPDGVLDLAAGATNTSSSLAASSSGWYFHIRAKDTAGTFGTTQHFGPILIDNVVPTGPTNLASSTHTVNVLSNQQNITITWTAGVDAESGLTGYQALFDHSSGTVLPGVTNVAAGATSFPSTLAPSTQGWWFHIRAKDVAGNLGTTQHLGPFLIGYCANHAANALYGTGKAGTSGVPALACLANPIVGDVCTVEISNAKPGAMPTMFLGLTPAAMPFDGGTILVQPTIISAIPLPIAANGKLQLTGPMPADPLICGVTFYLQFLIPDAGAAGFYHIALTKGMSLTVGS